MQGGSIQKVELLANEETDKGRTDRGKGGWQMEMQGFNPGELPLHTRSAANKKKQKRGRQEGLQRGAPARRQRQVQALPHGSAPAAAALLSTGTALRHCVGCPQAATTEAPMHRTATCPPEQSAAARARPAPAGEQPSCPPSSLLLRRQGRRGLQQADLFDDHRLLLLELLIVCTPFGRAARRTQQSTTSLAAAPRP